MKTPEDSEIERRLVLAIVLSLAILLGAPYLYKQFFPPAPEVAAPVTAPASQGGKSSLGEEAPAEVTPQLEQSSTERVSSSETGASGNDTAATAGFWEIESDDLLLRFSNHGAFLESARLPRYLNGTGEPLELVPQGLPDTFDRMLALRTGQETLDEELTQAIFEVSGVSGNRVRAPAEIEFTYRKGSLTARKLVKVPAWGYSLEVEVSGGLDGRTLPVSLSLGSGLGRVPGQNAEDFGDVQVAFHVNEGVERWGEGDLDEGVVRLETAPRWLALDSKYFAAALLAEGSIRGVRMERFEWTRPNAEGQAEVVPVVSGSADLGRGTPVRLFLGPKDAEALEQVEGSLSDLIDYGYFGVLVKPLVVALKWVHGYVGNYGWAIIILTFLINLALFPIRYKQIVSMEKMSALQPKLRSIQDRYKRMKKDDPRRQQMNTEVMSLYKEHGVNPLGGCLPLVIQMPILFAFYRMLYASIELRGAPFIWWIQDLSRHDPYFITPIVMGLTMVAQQKMTPATGDPTQRKMMMFLPIMFTAFFLWVSSGLAVYFLFSNLFAMMFQFGLKKLRGESMAVASGSGKSAKK